MELNCFGNGKEKICLRFYPCMNVGNNISWEEWHDKEPLVIYETDYQKLLLEYLTDLFPLVDPTNGTMQEYFDVCFDNWIDRDSWNRLTKKIKNDLSEFSDDGVIDFYQRFTDWCTSQLAWAEIIVVEGNL